MRTKTSNPGYFINQGRNHNYSNYLHIGHRGNNQYLLGFWGNDLECGEGTGTKGSYPEDIGRWTHLAFIVELEPNNTCKRKIYRNGELISQNSGRPQYVGSGELYIGLTPFWGAYYNDIDISDFIICHSIMTQEEVKSLWRSSPSQQSTTTSVPLTNPTNDDALYANDNIREISTSLNQYLFSGTEVYNSYNNDTLKSLFSTISYNNNSSENLKSYLDTGGKINGAAIDYFKINFLNSQIREEQLKDSQEFSVLATTIREDPTIANYTTLYNTIKDINYTSIIAVDNLSLKTGSTFLSIFGADKEAPYITFDKVSNINNLANPSLIPTVFVEVS
jgi:hypothetical protein